MLSGEMKIEPVTLTGKYVRLEPLSLDHLDGLCAVGLEEEIWRLGLAPVETRDDMRAYVETALRWQSEGTALPFATIAQPTNSVAGSTRFANIDVNHRRTEIGWTWLGKEWRRTPINTEAKYLMLTHAFETLGCIRVELKTDVLNRRSRDAMLRIGAKEEGIFRNHMITASGRFRDSVYYSIIESEWPGVKAGLEEMLARHWEQPANA
jgi:N-acetyltransferase